MKYKMDSNNSVIIEADSLEQAIELFKAQYEFTEITGVTEIKQEFHIRCPICGYNDIMVRPFPCKCPQCKGEVRFIYSEVCDV